MLVKQLRVICGPREESISKRRKYKFFVLVYLQFFQIYEFFQCSRLNVRDAVISERSATATKEEYSVMCSKGSKTSICSHSVASEFFN